MMHFKLLLVIISVGITLFISGCDKNDAPIGNPNSSNQGTMTDYEGNIYKTVKIGGQWWMLENLKTTHNANGILQNGVHSYNDDENNVSGFGRLYEYEAALSGALPGWHMQTDVERDILENTLGSEPGTKLKESGSSRFNAKLGGYRTRLGDYESIK